MEISGQTFSTVLWRYSMTDRIRRRNFVTGVAVGGIGLTATPPGPVQQPAGITQAGGSGAVDTGKPYFPMLLGNGVDHVLIGYSGTMGACAGHEQWQYEKTIIGWFKSDRKGPQGGSILNLLQCGNIVRRGIDADGIDTAGILATDSHEARKVTCCTGISGSGGSSIRTPA